MKKQELLHVLETLFREHTDLIKNDLNQGIPMEFLYTDWYCMHDMRLQDHVLKAVRNMTEDLREQLDGRPCIRLNVEIVDGWKLRLVASAQQQIEMTTTTPRERVSLIGLLRCLLGRGRPVTV